MKSSFLENLKNAVENGEFNSEAARRINEIDKMADNTQGLELNEEEREIAKENRLKNMQQSGVDVKSIDELKSEYDKKMQEIKERDLVLSQQKILVEMDDMIMLSIMDMNDFISTLEEKFSKDNLVHAPIFNEINRLKTKYSSINNK